MPFHICPTHGVERCYASSSRTAREVHYCSRGESGKSWNGYTYRDAEAAVEVAKGAGLTKKEAA